MYGRAFTEEEISFLRDNCKTMTRVELGKALGRSHKAIGGKLQRLGLTWVKEKRKPWNKADDRKLVKLLKKQLSYQEIGRIMQRSKNSISVRAKRLKLKKPFRSVHLNINRFYQYMRAAKFQGTLFMQCCLCEYDKHIDLHHIDGNRKNNHILNIATLCPNHHREVEAGEHTGITLYSIWFRYDNDGNAGKRQTNQDIESYLIDNPKYLKFDSNGLAA